MSALRYSHKVSILFIGVGALILAFPMLIYGPSPGGHDASEHLAFDRHFSEQFWAGEPYPTWLIGMNHGLGSPSLFVYPPLESYMYAFTEPISTVFGLDAAKVPALLALFASGICSFLWLDTFCTRQIALGVALLYMLMPYHLAVDFYHRTALPECWALAWMPLVLFFTARIVNERKGAILGFAVAQALLILSHPTSALIFSVVPIGAALVFASRKRRLPVVWRVVEGMILGAGLCSFYLIPAFAYARYFPLDKYLFPVSTFLIGPRNLFLDRGFGHTVAITALDTLVVCMLGGVAVLLNGAQESKKAVCYWLGICASVALMMSSLSEPLWARWHVLLLTVQYQYRLNIVLCLAAAAILGIFLGQKVWTYRTGAFLTAIVGLVVGTWAYSYWKVWDGYLDASARGYKMSREDGQFADDGLFLGWSVSGLDEGRALQASAGPRVRFSGATGTTRIFAWAPRHIEFEAASADGGQVIVSQFYYPLWRAILSGSGELLKTDAAMPEGLVEVRVPPGQAKVALEIGVGPAEIAGRWTSATSVLLAVSLLLYMWRGKGRHKLRETVALEAGPTASPGDNVERSDALANTHSHQR